MSLTTIQQTCFIHESAMERISVPEFPQFPWLNVWNQTNSLAQNHIVYMITTQVPVVPVFRLSLDAIESADLRSTHTLYPILFIWITSCNRCEVVIHNLRLFFMITFPIAKCCQFMQNSENMSHGWFDGIETLLLVNSSFSPFSWSNVRRYRMYSLMIFMIIQVNLSFPRYPYSDISITIVCVQSLFKFEFCESSSMYWVIIALCCSPWQLVGLRSF
jgi:hypothetical protein